MHVDDTSCIHAARTRGTRRASNISLSPECNTACHVATLAEDAVIPEAVYRELANVLILGTILNYYVNANTNEDVTPSLYVKVPIMRRDRIDSVVKRANTGKDSALQLLVAHSPTIKSELDDYREIGYQGEIVRTRGKIDSINTRELYRTADGIGLKHRRKGQ